MSCHVILILAEIIVLEFFVVVVVEILSFKFKTDHDSRSKKKREIEYWVGGWPIVN